MGTIRSWRQISWELGPSIEPKDGTNLPAGWRAEENLKIGRGKFQIVYFWVEQEMRPGGRENWQIKIIETAGKPLEKVLVKTDPFNGNSCSDKSCLSNRNKNNRISCRRNSVGYRIPCKICLRDGRQKCGVYIGETGENMHVRMKSHLTKFYSKKQEIRDSSAFRKHLHNSHGGVGEEEKFEDLFEVEIIKAYSKPMTRQTEEGTFMINIDLYRQLGKGSKIKTGKLSTFCG